jgi:hypothetical protein
MYVLDETLEREDRPTRFAREVCLGPLLSFTANLNNQMRLAAVQCGKACLTDQKLFCGGYASVVCWSGGAASKSKVELPVRQSLTALGSGKPRCQGCVLSKGPFVRFADWINYFSADC